jgi:hypothetical protein
MGYKKPTETTKQYLTTAPLPNHGKSYTVIPHQKVINKTLDLLEQANFEVTRELYRANMDAKVAQGIYHIKPRYTTDEQIRNEEELGMMFAWTNSYDKSVRFQCAIGGYVMVCHNGMVCGDMMTFARKHTGTADSEIESQIANQIKNAEVYFKKILDTRDSLRSLPLTKKEQSEMLGRLFFDENVLEISQLTCIKDELEKPSYDYNCDQENAWTFYNHVTHALKKTHPRNWLSDSQKFHEFITADLLGNMGIKKGDDFDLDKFEISMDNNEIDIEIEDGTIEIIDGPASPGIEYNIIHLGK